MALAVLVTGCSDEAQDNGGLGAPNATTLVARYEGEWKVGNHYAGKGEVGVYSTGFDLSTIPYAAILRMPCHTVTWSVTLTRAMWCLTTTLAIRNKPST